MSAQAELWAPALWGVPCPREECGPTPVSTLRLGWTILDAHDSGREASTQARLLGRHLSRQEFFLRQVHRTGCVVLVDGAPLPVHPVEADGILTNRRDLLFGVGVADCLPLYLVSEKAVAVLHAGWRGVLAGLLPLALRGLQSNFGSELQQLELLIGPGIGPCCFEVSPAVWMLFPPDCRVERAGRLHLDLALAVTKQWHEAGGILAVRRLDRCTRCSIPRLHSFRRDGGRGRNFAYLYYS